MDVVTGSRSDRLGLVANRKSASVALEGEGWRHQRNIVTGEIPGPTSLPRGGHINGLLYAGERRAGPRTRTLEKKGKRRRKRVGGLLAAYEGACEYRMRWEAAISNWGTAGSEEVVKTAVAAALIDEKPVPVKWALVAVQVDDDEDE